MIKNEKQYAITKKHVESFNKALEILVSEKETEPSSIKSIQIAAIKSQTEELQEEINEYESLKNGHQRILHINSLDEIYKVLIKARIAAKLTHKELADKLDLKEQQIQRWEASDYETVDIGIIQEICDVLGIKILFEKITITNTEFDRPQQMKNLDLDGIQDEIRIRGNLFCMN